MGAEGESAPSPPSAHPPDSPVRQRNKISVHTSCACVCELRPPLHSRTALEKLPETADIPALLSKIHGQAKIVGLEIKDFERLPEISQGFYSMIPVLMSLEGTYQQIATFFYYVGKLTRIVNLNNIELTAETRDRTVDPVLLNGRVLATTFRYSPMAAGGGGGGGRKGKKGKKGGH